MGGVFTMKSILSVALLALLSLVLVMGCSHENRYYEYTPENWAAAKVNERYEMSCDLVKKGILIGKTRNEIISILGEDGIEEKYAVSEEKLVYLVGHTIIDSFWLITLFDAEGIATEVSVIDS